MDKLLNLINEYYKTFGENFPLIQAPGDDTAIKHIEKSLKENKSVEELYPEFYGSLIGKLV